MLNASDVRDFALSNGHKVGERGRLPRHLFVEYLAAHPRVAREVATANGVAIAQRGRISVATLTAIAETVR
jgi:hypothetical protein